MEELIYDRTTQDVTNKTSKGYHNYTDLNRVEEWCEYLAEMLNGYGYRVVIQTKTDWDMLDERTESEMERIRNNVGKIKNAYYIMLSTPALPNTLNPIDVGKANDIERILFDIDFLLEKMQNRFVRCGVCNCGQNRVWQQRFRQVTRARRRWIDLDETYWNEFTDETWQDIGLEG